MSSPHIDEIRRLKAELASAKQTIDRVGQGLNQLELQMGQQSPAPPRQPVTGPVAAPTPAAPTPVAQAVPVMRPQLPPPTQPPSALVAWWQRESTIVRVLGIAGAIVTLIGLVLLLVLAVQQNWFTPTLRVVLGTALSVGLVALAWRLRATERRAGRSGGSAVALAATGHAGLYLVVLAITQLYHWVSTPVGLALAGVVAIAGIATAVKWQSEQMAIIQVVAIGLLAFPLAQSPGLAAAFVVIMAVGLAPAHLRTWPRLGVVNFVTAGFVLLTATSAFGTRPHEALLLTVVCAAFYLAGIGFSVADARRRRATASGVVAAIASGLPWLAVAWDHGTATAVVLLLVAVVIGFAAFVLTPRDRTDGDGFGWATMVTPTLAVLVLVTRLPGSWDYPAATLLAAATVFVLVAGVLRAEPVAGAGAVLSATGLLSLLPLLLSSFSRDDMADQPWVPVLVTGLLAAVWAGSALWTVSRLARMQSARSASLVLAVLLGLLGLMLASVATGVGVGRSIGDEDAGFTSGHAIGTIVWMLAAAILLVRGLKRAEHADLGVKLALGLAAVAVAKLFLYDLAALDGIWRGAAFVVVGLLLLGLGIGYAKALERAKAAADGVTPRPPSALHGPPGSSPKPR
ncbi:DUF2339 domain-containing protein [Propionibacteriaceae bacterium G57]|uniref:DUF2339 domain-containing protein n=1 Tax=Aestuariimicrobium sp. G57 TaxID=3418485 RepID=UPI003DA7352F